MPEYAPGFSGDVLPKPSNPLNNAQVTDGIANNVIGAAAGTNVTVTRTRVGRDANGDNAGKRVIEQATLINRNTNASDVTALKNKVIRKNGSLAFPRDLSGNGGPAFTRS